MKTDQEAIFIGYKIRQAYTRKDNGAHVPEKYELCFIEADTHEFKKFIVDQKPLWVDEAKETGYLKGTLECDMEKDLYSQNTDAYRARFSAFTDREIVTLA